MARCYSKEFGGFSGRVGNVIFYKRKGEFYARAYPAEVKDRRSELQLFNRERMRHSATFYGIVKLTQLARVWQVAGWRNNRSAYNLFVQANIRAFNGTTLLYELVHFSLGSLCPPRDMQAYREGNKIRLTWKNDGLLSGERLGDELWCVVMTEDKNFRVVEPGEIESLRGEESAEIKLSEEPGEKVHLYCFFGSVGMDDFSENLYFEL